MKIDERRQQMVCYTASGNALITHAIAPPQAVKNTNSPGSANQRNLELF